MLPIINHYIIDHIPFPIYIPNEASVVPGIFDTILHKNYRRVIKLVYDEYNGGTLWDIKLHAVKKASHTTVLLLVVYCERVKRVVS